MTDGREVIIPGVPVASYRHSRVLQQPLAAPRRGVMLHYDDSSRDDWAVAWFDDPRCKNGYTWLVLHDGAVVQLADPGMRTPHAGPCLTPCANSAYYGIAAATNGSVLATPQQVDAIVTICVAVFIRQGWSDASVAERIVGHDAQAIWTKAYTSDRALWGKTGRKVDPTGQRADRKRIIDIDLVRQRVARQLGDRKGAV